MKEDDFMQIVFESSNILFIKVSPSLAKDYQKMINDLEVTKYFESRAPFTLEQEIAWANEKLADNSLVFSMIEKKTNEFIGNIELMDVDDATRELGIIITLDKQNKGYGKEAIRALLNYGKEVVGLQKIILRTNPLNLRAIHVYLKCGFIETNRDEKHVYMQKLL